MRVTNHTVAPMYEAGTHHVIGCEVLVVGVRNHHNSLFVRRICNVGCTVQIPNHVAGYLPSILLTRKLLCAKRLCHKFQTVVIDQVCCNRLSLGIFTNSEIAFNEQVYTSLLVYLTYKVHLALCGYVCSGKLKVMYQHLEDSFLAGGCIVTLRNAYQFGYQRNITKLQCEIVVSVCTVKICTALVSVAELI